MQHRPSGRSQFTDVANVTAAHRPQLRGQHRRDGYGLSRKSDELNYVSRAVAVDMHDRADIARLQALIGDVSRQHNAIMFLNHNASKGYAVIRRGATWPSSTCQTVRTRGRRPSGATNSPSTSYRGPKPVCF